MHPQQLRDCLRGRRIAEQDVHPLPWRASLPRRLQILVVLRGCVCPCPCPYTCPSSSSSLYQHCKCWSCVCTFFSSIKRNLLISNICMGAAFLNNILLKTHPTSYQNVLLTTVPAPPPPCQRAGLRATQHCRQENA